MTGAAVDAESFAGSFRATRAVSLTGFDGSLPDFCGSVVFTSAWTGLVSAGVVGVFEVAGVLDVVGAFEVFGVVEATAGASAGISLATRDP
jgi:hypothetical protein